MSNTSKVTPYESIRSSDVSEKGLGVAAVCIGAMVVGTVALVRWLAEETPEDKAIVQRFKADLRRERLESHKLTTVNLHLEDPGTLISSAEKLGYKKIEKPVSLAKEPVMLLSNASGERLAIGRNDNGNLTLHTASPMPQIQNIIRQHTMDRAIDHLKSKGMNIQTTQKPDGEIHILAREMNTSRRGGAAEIKTRVNKDGTIMVDIDKVKGNRCEEIVKELAQALGGQVSDMKKKDSYFQLPGEPTKTKVRI